MKVKELIEWLENYVKDEGNHEVVVENVQRDEIYNFHIFSRFGGKLNKHLCLISFSEGDIYEQF